MTLETERLRGEALAEKHAAELARLYADPAVMATLGGVRTEAETRAAIAAESARWERDGMGMWALFLRESGAFAGRGGLRRCEVAGGGEVEIAWAIRPEWQGRGLETEMARRCVELALGELGLASVVAFTTPENGASRRVMEKAGMEFERSFDRGGVRHVLYRRRAQPPPTK